MYFIREGECECSLFGKGVVAVKHSGEFFGEIALFMTGERTATVTTRTLCELVVLTKTDIDLVAESFPDLKVSIADVAHAHTSELLKKGKMTASAEASSKAI